MAILEALLAWVAGLLVKDLALPVVEDLLSGKTKVALATSTLVDAPAQGALEGELQDDLETQIAAGGVAPVGVGAD